MSTGQELGILTTDRELVVRSWDGWLAAVTGIPAAAAQGRSLTELFPELEARGMAARLRRVIAEGVVEVLAPAFHHYLLPCPPRTPSPHFDRMQQRATLAPLRKDEEIVGVLVTIEDVTERRNRERELAAELKLPEEERRLRAVKGLADSDESQRLVEVLGDESWRVRRAAVDALARRTTRDTVKDLIRSLQKEHNNLSVLNSALQILALSDLDALTPLTDFLGDPDVELRIYAALLLGERHDDRAVPALLASLADPDPNVRYHVIEALGKLRAAGAVDALLAVAETKDFFLAFPALDALSRIGDARAAERIVPLLEDPLLCSPAAAALGNIGERDVIPPLAALLNKPGAPVAVIAQALTVIHERYEYRYREGSHIADAARRVIGAAGAQQLIDAVQEAPPEEIRSLAVVLGWLEGPAVEQAMTRLLGNPAVRGEVVEALARYGKRVAELVVEQLDREDLDTRKAAIIALGRIGDARAVPALTRILTDDDELVVFAAGALAKIGDRQAFDALIGLLGHPNATVRQAAVGALNSIGHPEMGERMATLLADPDPLIREAAVRIAGYFGYDNCRELLIARTADADENVRRTAVEHLPYLDDPRVPDILHRLVRDASPRIRAAAVRALTQLDDPETRPALLSALDDPDPWVRYFAAGAVGRPGNDAALPALSRLLRGDPAGHVRIAAAKALGEIDGAETVTLLSSFIDSPERDLALAALAALGRSDHPDARARLLKTLRHPDPARREVAVRSLGRHCDVTVADTLQWTAAADGEEEVGRAAVEVLGKAATPEAVTALLGLLREPARREAAIAALAGMGDEQLAWMADAFSRSGPETRPAIIEVLVRMKRPGATALIVSALDDGEAKVRMAAVQALARLGSRRAERRLSLMASADPDPDVRRAARQALGNI
ncbi:MAG TPA: HEAT repeat domain-containing protein [Syntrophales bacterium]|nr:HEAT repeat domain-containing protein [Syntrophales bacterium]HQI36413.1 HEAT repeat domain-containing protein [Syntrophales bacterium]